jgi:hypothetical protein
MTATTTDPLILENSVEAGVPADEIEITPAMVQAGEAVLWDGPFLAYASYEEIAHRIIERALKARHRKTSTREPAA